MLTKVEFSKYILKNPQIPNFKKTPSTRIRVVSCDKQTEERTDGWKEGNMG
jgi:hypothetical protein